MINVLPDNIFSTLPELQVLDTGKSSVVEFSRTVLKPLTQLEELHSENYKLCCSLMLPEGFDPRHCHTTLGPLDSCQDLLQYDTYRASLWLFCVLSVVGNVSSLFTR